MVLIRLLLIFSCTAALAASWKDAVLARRRASNLGARWTFCVRPGLLSGGSLAQDPDYQRLATGGNWGVEVLGAAPAQELRTSEGADWALLTPEGDVAGTGAGQPTGSRLLDAIHRSGHKARFEIRDAFLKDHPDQGEAWRDALKQELRILRNRLVALDAQGEVRVPAWHAEPGTLPEERISLAGAEGDAQAGNLYEGMFQAYRHLCQVPGWTREASLVAAHLAQVRLGQSLDFQRLFASQAPELEEEAAANPGDASLLHLWIEVLDGAGRLPESPASRFIAPPGEVWPDPESLPLLLEPFRRRGDAAGELRLLTDLAPSGPPEPSTPAAWSAYCSLQGALMAQRSAVQAGLGAWDEARSALDEAMKWGAGRGAVTALLRRSVGGRAESSREWRAFLLRTASHAQPQPPPPPQPPPLRLVLQGRPSWLSSWLALRAAPELALWGPAELRWEAAPAAPQAQARTRTPEEARHRWALFRGEDLLASGDTPPQAKGLASILAGHGTPFLDLLGRRIAADPGNAAARRARFEALLTRMPDPRLEPLLAEDAAKVRLALPFGPSEAWKPSEELWSGAAQAVLPALEAQLQCWPSDPDLWQAWVSWARFHPARPSILALVNRLPFWSPDADWRAFLPYEVQRTVAAELRRQGAFGPMRDWFQAVWDLLDHRPLADVPSWQRTTLQKSRAEEETAIFQPLRDACRALGLNAQVVELERTFGAMTGKGVASRR